MMAGSTRTFGRGCESRSAERWCCVSTQREGYSTLSRRDARSKERLVTLCCQRVVKTVLVMACMRIRPCNHPLAHSTQIGTELTYSSWWANDCNLSRRHK